MTLTGPRPFTVVHHALTVELIMTPLDDLRTCAASADPREQQKWIENPEQSDLDQPRYHHLPVTDGQGGPIVGFFSVTCPCPKATRRVEDAPGFRRITQEDLLGASTRILDFIGQTRDEPHPFLVVGEQGVCGLVNSADLVDPVVGMALSARILEFETSLNGWIKARFDDSDEWRDKLKGHGDALTNIDKRHQKARGSGIEPNFAWMFGMISDKLTILGVDCDRRRQINGLRNEVLHTRPPSKIREVMATLCETERMLARRFET